MSTLQLILKYGIGIVLVGYGIMSVYAGTKRHETQKNFASEMLEKKEKNEVIKYLLKFNEDNGYMIGILMIAYGLDLIFLR